MADPISSSLTCGGAEQSGNPLPRIRFHPISAPPTRRYGSRLRFRERTLARRLSVWTFERQDNRNHGSVTFRGRAGVDFHPSSVTLDELFRDKESDAGADGPVGGEEGIEDSGQHFRRNANASVFNE